MKRVIYIIIVLFLFSSCDKEKNYLRDGNKKFDKKEFNKAEDLYRKALTIDSTYKNAQYNLANSIYKQSKETGYEKALMYYDKSLMQDSIMDTNFLANTLYNRANTNFQIALLDSINKTEKYNESLQKAINDYKKTLKINSQDSAAKYNLSLAMHLLNKNKSQSQQNKQQNKQNKQNQSQNKEDKNQQKGDEEKMQKPMNQDNERMLEALKNNEKNTLQRLKKEKDKNNKQIKNEKDW